MLEVNIILGIIGILNFVFNYRKWTASNKKAGIINYQWSTKLNPRIPRNRIYLFFLFVYLLVSFYFLLSPPKMMSDYTMFVLFLLVMSFIPKWKAAVGSSAIILGGLIIPNDKILYKKIVSKGKSRFLEIKWSPKESSSVVKEKMVPVPFQRLDF